MERMGSSSVLSTGRKSKGSSCRCSGSWSWFSENLQWYKKPESKPPCRRQKREKWIQALGKNSLSSWIISVIKYYHSISRYTFTFYSFILSCSISPRMSIDIPKRETMKFFNETVGLGFTWICFDNSFPNTLWFWSQLQIWLYIIISNNIIVSFLIQLRVFFIFGQLSLITCLLTMLSIMYLYLLSFNIQYYLAVKTKNIYVIWWTVWWMVVCVYEIKVWVKIMSQIWPNIWILFVLDSFQCCIAF